MSGNQRVFDYDYSQIVFTNQNVLTAATGGGSNGSGNLYRYLFNQGTTFRDCQIAFQQLVVYYSWFNITAANNNNIFYYSWPMSNTGTTTFQITLPDGYYSVADVNNNLQAAMIGNGHYLIDNSSGNFVYLLEIQTNATYYRNQITSWTYASLPAAQTALGLPQLAYPSASPTWGFTGAAGSGTPSAFPYISVPVVGNISSAPLVWQSPYWNSLSFASFLGFSPIVSPYNGNFPAAGTTLTTSAGITIINISKQSSFPFSSSNDPTFTPEAEPIQTVTINISQAKNVLSTSQSQAIGFFTPVGTSFGYALSISAKPELAWFDLLDGNYGFIDMTLLDQNYRPIMLQDPVTFANFLIRTRPDRKVLSVPKPLILNKEEPEHSGKNLDGSGVRMNKRMKSSQWHPHSSFRSPQNATSTLSRDFPFPINR